MEIFLFPKSMAISRTPGQLTRGLLPASLKIATDVKEILEGRLITLYVSPRKVFIL